MITLERNKQKMKYANKIERVPIYEIDEEGNIKYQIVDGVSVPTETGNYMSGYGDVVDFRAVITNKLNEVIIREYGIDDSTNYAQIVSSKGFLPFKVGTLIWKSSEVAYMTEYPTMLDETSADYVVMGVADEGLDFDLFLLKRNVK